MEFVEKVLGVGVLGAFGRAVPVDCDAGRSREGSRVDAPFCATDDGVGVAVGDFEKGGMGVEGHAVELSGGVGGDVDGSRRPGPEDVVEGVVCKGGELGLEEVVEVGWEGFGEEEGHFWRGWERGDGLIGFAIVDGWSVLAVGSR